MIPVDQADRDLLRPELERLAGTLPAGSALRHQQAELLAALDGEVVPHELEAPFEHTLELLLSSGRIRKSFGPHEEAQILRLYQRTPAGVRQKEQLRKVNDALEGLKGQTLEGFSFALKSPGVYRLELATDEGDLAITIDRQAVRVHQVEVSL